MAIIPPDPLPSVPPPDPFVNPGQKAWLANLLSALKTSLSSTVNQNTAADYIMLKSPDGATHKLTVDNDGNVGSHPIK